MDTLEYLIQFIGRLRNDAGCRKFIIHARKCVLGRLLSPEQNRIISPLNYPRVYALCDHLTDCTLYVLGCRQIFLRRGWQSMSESERGDDRIL